MIREYRTIREVSGPLMIVKNVEGVTYDELAELELPNGEVRHCKVLECSGDTAVVQLFENSAGINLKDSRDWHKAPMMKNNIVWGNSLPVIASNILSSAILSHSLDVECFISDPMEKMVVSSMMTSSMPGRNVLLR